MNPVILSKNSPAFTLLELLVAVAVLSLLLVVLLNIVQSTTTLWRVSENRVEAYREARAALQVMASDLKGILPSTNTNYFRTNLINSSPNVGFLAALPLSAQDTNSKSDICTVGYFLAYGNKSPVAGADGRLSYNLYRYIVESGATFTNLSASSALFNDPTPANTDRAEILARNIVGFQIKPLMTNSTGFTNWTYNATTAPMPTLLEIQLTAINNERTMRFENNIIPWTTFTANQTSTDYLKNTKTFTTRIKLNTP